MPVGTCPECNGKLSTSAPACPHCGYRRQSPRLRGLATIVVSLLVIGLVIWFMRTAVAQGQDLPDDQVTLLGLIIVCGVVGALYGIYVLIAGQKERDRKDDGSSSPT